MIFEVDRQSDLPPWLQLRNRLAYLITSGHFKPGEKLPTVRGLAADISINFVRDISPVEVEKLNSFYTLIEDCVQACLAMGFDFDEVHKRINKKMHDMKQERMENDS